MRTQNESRNTNSAAKSPHAGVSPEVEYASVIQTSTDYAAAENVLHRWNDRIWRPIEPTEAEREAFQWLATHPLHANKATPRLAASCVQAAAMTARNVPHYKHDPAIILPVKNGYLHVDTKAGTLDLQPPEPGYGLTYEIECHFDAQAAAPEFADFCAQILPDPETREYVQDYVGYTLMPDCRYQRASFWLGSGANGKSTLAEVVAALHARTVAIELNQLDGFQLLPLAGASLVYVDETPARINEQRLKMLLSGGLVSIDRKFRDPVILRPTAKWIILGNHLPAVSDQSHGFWRRLGVVPFTTQIAEEHQDPLLAGRIIRQEC